MRYLVLILVFVFVIGCKESNLKKSVKNTNELKVEVNNFLNDWHLAATEANYKDYFDKMDEVSIFIGTDASENWSKKAFSDFSKPYFDRGKAWDFKTLERNIYFNSDKNIVWFDELLDTWMGTCRGSGVLELNDNSWKIKHYVLSIAIPNEDVKNVIVIKRKNDSLFLRRFQ